MRTKLYGAIFTGLLTATVAAQTPQYLNNNTNAGANAIPFDAGTQVNWRRAQFFIPANSMGSVPGGHQITTVYFKTSTTGSVTYPNIYVRLKTGSGTGLTGVVNGPFEPNMVTVFHGVNHTLNTTGTNWFSIALTTYFPYDPTQPLIVEVEHDHPNAAGPTVYQAVNIPGPGNGRQYGNTGGANISGVGGTQVNFGIDVIPNVPCVSAPDSNAVVPANFTTCPGITNPSVTLANSYTLGGITYQWYSSSSSSVGPFTAVTGATLASVGVPTLASSIWYQLVATCTNVSASTTLSPGHIYVDQSVTTNTPPYHESFEGLQTTDRLPNCSWFSAELGSTARTFTAAGPNNLVANNGSKFAAFFNSPAGTSHYFTNGLSLEAGVTYSASLWYQTDLTGAINWSDLSILIGTSQSSTGLTGIVSTNGPAVGIIYKPLSGTFSVASPGIYYIAVRAAGGAGNADYLAWDDLRVEIPCSLNSPTVSILAGSTDVCAGDPVILTAAGADSFTWNNNGGSGNVITINPFSPELYTATGTNNNSGCSSTASVFINVKPKPQVSVLASPPVACSGAPLHLIAAGATSYTWSTGAQTPMILDHPSVNASYTVTGSNSFQCQDMAVYNVTVNPNPVLLVDGPVTICAGETAQLQASGATSYTWMANTVFITDNPVMIKPASTTNYTVAGSDANGCTGVSIYAITVNACTGLQELSKASVSIHPNPTSGRIVMQSGKNSPFRYSVSDVSGRVILSGHCSGNCESDLTEAPSGLYLVTLTSENETHSIRLIKD